MAWDKYKKVKIWQFLYLFCKCEIMSRFFKITLKLILKLIFIFKSLGVNIRHNYYLHAKVFYSKRIYKQK